MRTTSLVALLLVWMVTGTAAQTTMETNPVTNTLRQTVQRQSKAVVAAAEEMPADKYSYHLTPDQATFAHLIIHIATGNELFCSKISGTASPSARKLSEPDSKQTLVTALKASFDYCTQVLEKVDDSKLGEGIALFGGTWTRAAIIFQLSNAFADHYCEESMYLRLNGFLPPTAQPAK
jgi:hypothetical protein